MTWTPLPRGAFTGIDWSARGAATGMDPYLAWAEASAFSGYGYAHGALPHQLPLLIEIRPGKTIRDLENASQRHWLTIPAAYRDTDAPAGLRYCTALVRHEFFREFRKPPLADVISRFELGLPAGNPAASSSATAAELGKPPARLKGKVLGLIDGGLAFANANFLRQGAARTQYFWRQDKDGVGAIPHGWTYGHELTGADIDATMDRCRFDGMVDESAVYRHFRLFDLQRLVNHGTHVMDIACGPRTVTAQMANVPPSLDAPPSWALADDDASRCDIVAVQLDWHTILDTSGGSINVQIMDALMYILSRCEPRASIAINLSWGTLAGPHDGTSVLEAAMDQLAGLRPERLKIVVPAGNSYQSRTHANHELQPGQQQSLTWCVQADDRTQSFVELWLAGRTGPFEGGSVRLTPPGSEPLPWVAVGDSGMWVDAGGSPQCAVIFPRTVATGTTGTCALLALAPTSSFGEDATTAPCGPWRIDIRNDGKDSVIFDAYIERDDVPIGVAGHGGRQSYFTDALYDTSGNPGSFVDHPGNPTPIRRSGNFNSLSTGTGSVRVGGVRVSDGSWAHYSPQAPDPDPTQPRRPGVVRVPDRQAFSDQNAAATGLYAAGTASGSRVRLVGTSSAAPQQAREELNRLP